MGNNEDENVSIFSGLDNIGNGNLKSTDKVSTKYQVATKFCFFGNASSGDKS
jgi:hypothetical protein